MPKVSDLFRVFLRIGLLSFGGPAAQIAVMHKELVEDRLWLTEAQFLNALSFCMLLPGPEAMQLATYAGWRLRGWRGGLIGGLLFVLPGAVVMMGLGLIYILYGHVPLVAAMFIGIQATVVIIVLQALWRLGHKALKTKDRWMLAGLSFLGIFCFAVPFPLIILAAAIYGWATVHSAEIPPRSPQRMHRARPLATAGFWATLWAAPVVMLWGTGQIFLTEIAVFFSKLAVVTFGGAYAVLGYMTQEVVQDHGWISTAQMMDGLGLAETTPGPLILVTQFVGMIAGAGAGGVPLALAAGAITLWVTFVPCFLWIFTAAPYVDAISARPRIAAALSAITAAVVGVILNLSVWFAVHVFFAQTNLIDSGPLALLVPEFGSIRLLAVFLAVLAGGLLIWRRMDLMYVLAISATISMAFTLIS